MRYCLNCRVVYHEGMSCHEYQVDSREDANDLAFMKMAKGKKFKQCTKCRFWVERSAGCDSMKCRCGHGFCYKCGGDYGKCECVQKRQERAQQLIQQAAARRRAAAIKRKETLAKKRVEKEALRKR